MRHKGRIYRAVKHRDQTYSIEIQVRRGYSFFGGLISQKEVFQPFFGYMRFDSGQEALQYVKKIHAEHCQKVKDIQPDSRKPRLVY